MKRDLILAIDLGTTGCKTIVFDKNGNDISEGYEEYESIYLSPTWIDHDPQTWLDATQNTIRIALEKLNFDPEQIEAIAVTSQRATFTPVNEKGTPLANAMLWQDKRAVKEAKLVEEKIGNDYIYEKTGVNIDPYFTLPKLMWFRDNKREKYKKMYKFLSVDSLIINYLTGEFVMDWTQASRTMLFDLDNFKWDYEIAEKMEIDTSKLPETIEPGEIAGSLKNSIADELGLPADIPVVAAGGDQQCAAVGLGIIKSDLVEANTGTGSFVLAHSDQAVRDDKKRVICSASAVAGKWVMEAGIFTTGSVYRWFRDNFGGVEIDTGHKLGMDPYEIMNAEAKESSAGANGLLLIPHFAASGAPYWNPDANGVLYGLALGHERSDVVRSFLEGIALEINKNIEIIEELIGDPQEVRVSGGATKSPLFNQIQADVYNKPVIKTNYKESSALGAAILAAKSVGVYGDLDSAVNKMVRLDSSSRKLPRENKNKIYNKVQNLHDDIYKSLNNNNIYEKSSDINNYIAELEK